MHHGKKKNSKKRNKNADMTDTGGNRQEAWQASPMYRIEKRQIKEKTEGLEKRKSEDGW